MEGKKVILFYNDTAGSVSKLIGFLIEQSPDFIKIKTPSGVVEIPCAKIVRIEYANDYWGDENE